MCHNSESSDAHKIVWVYIYMQQMKEFQETSETEEEESEGERKFLDAH